MIRQINIVFMKHARWLFGIFTVVIVITFLGFLTPGQFGVGGCADPGEMRVGMAFGKPVTYNELREQKTAQAVLGRLLYGMNMNDIPDQTAFAQVCVQRAAEARGISVSDNEVADMIKTLSIFAVNGKFDYKRYEEQNALLRQQGIDSELIISACRSALYGQKLSQELTASLVVTPGEVEQFYKQLNTTYQLKTASFTYDKFVKNVKVKPEALKAYFEANRSSYKIPAMLEAEVAVFSFTSPEALKYGAKVTDKDIEAWYAKNSASFTKDGKVQPLTAVKADAKARCAAERIRIAVTRDAQKLATEAYGILDEAKDKKAAMVKLLADRKIKTVKTGKFAAGANAAGSIAEPGLVRELSAVYTVPVTNAVPGNSAAYVGFLTSRVEEHAAEFNEVAAKVQDDFIREEAVKLARAAAEAEAKKLNAMKPAQRTAAKVWGKPFSFSMMTPPADMIGMQAASVAVELADNEISKVQNTADGAMLVCIVKRTPADMKNFAAQKAQWEAMWRQSKMQSIFADFDNYLQSQCVFEMEGRK